jgi:hypothetical protein
MRAADGVVEMSSRRLKFVVHDHNRRSLALANALLSAGHQLVQEGPADVFLVDLDPPHPLPHRRVIDRHKAQGAKIIVYPHGGGVLYAYDGLYKPHTKIDANLVIGPGHAEYMRRVGYPHPVHTIGWSLCEQRPFRRCGDVRRVVFAPTHPNADGSMTDRNRDENADLFRRLLECGFDLTVRHIGTLEENGLWEVEGVEFVNGRLVAETAELDSADAVVAGEGTYPMLAVARGAPTVMYGQAAGSSLGLPGERLTLPQRGERYLDYVRYPFDAADGPLEQVIAAAATAEGPTVEWKRRFIGRPFDPRAFVALIERIARSDGSVSPQLDSTRRFTTLAFADELVERPELLAAYAAAVSPSDDASLVLWSPGVDGQLLLAMAEAAIAASGVDPEALPDILLAPHPGSPATERLLADRADAVLSDWPRFGRLGKLPRFADAFVA